MEKFLCRGDIRVFTVAPGAAIKRKLKTACTLLVILINGFSVGQLQASANKQQDYLTEEDVYGDIPMVTSGSRFEQKQAEAPVSITVIDSEMIAASGATEIHELLRFAPGFFAYSVYGNQFGVVARSPGVNFPGQLEVMVNGRSVYLTLFSTVEWSSLGIDVADIDYIEVARGPSAAVYGSNAFLGAINIVTKKAAIRPATTLRAAGGNIHRRDYTLNHSGSANDVDYGASFVFRSNEGFSRIDEVKSTQDMVDGRESFHFSLTGNYTPSLIDEIEFDLGVGRSDLELPIEDVRGYFNREFDEHYQRVKWKRATDGIENSVQFYQNYTAIEDDNNLGLGSDLLGVDPATFTIITGQPDQFIFSGVRDGISQRFDLEIQQINRTVDNLTFVVGAGARLDRIRSHFLLGQNGSIEETKYRLFGSADWRINDQFNTNVGVMVENTRYAGTLVSPRASLNWQANPRHAFRIGAAWGNRAPSILEAEEFSGIYFADGSLANAEGNSASDIGEEKVTAYELAYIANFPEIQTVLDIRIFTEEVRDGIKDQILPFGDIDGEIITTTNIIDYDIHGFELQLVRNLANGILARLGYAYLDLDGKFIREPSDPGNVDDLGIGVPTHSANFLIQKTFANGYSVSGWIYYQTESDSVDGKLVDTFTRIDVRLAKRFSYGNTSGLVELVTHNLFGEYTDFEEDNIFKTRSFLRIQLDF